MGLELWLNVRITQGNKKQSKTPHKQCQGPSQLSIPAGRGQGNPVLGGLQASLLRLRVTGPGVFTQHKASAVTRENCVCLWNSVNNYFMVGLPQLSELCKSLKRCLYILSFLFFQGLNRLHC